MQADVSYYPRKIAEIDNLFIEEEYRNMQIRTMLIDKFKELCKEKGVDTIKVNASAPNEKALQFYRKNGFKEHDITLWIRS